MHMHRLDRLLQEIILHTLFESGVSKVQELERYVTDDIERNGVRLLELEKKLVNAYREAVRSSVFCSSNPV